MRACSHWLILTASLLLNACAGSPSINTKSGTRPLLTLVHTLSGARIIPRLGSTPTSSTIPSPDYITWLSLTAVRGNRNYLYLIDKGRDQIYQYDRIQQSVFTFANIHVANVTAIDIASDMSVYVGDSKAHIVRHFSWDGKLLQTFAHDRELSRPVAIIANNATGQVLVADGLYNQVIIFSRLGQLLSVLRTPQTHSLTAMAQGPDGLYLVDNLSRKVVVIGYDGLYRYTLGTGTLEMPKAIAVDSYNRVFISDNFDNAIKIYQNGRWIATFGGSGATPGRFNQISDLWLEGNLLHVADRMTGRLQTFLVAPPENTIAK